MPVAGLPSSAGQGVQREHAGATAGPVRWCVRAPRRPRRRRTVAGSRGPGDSTRAFGRGGGGRAAGLGAECSTTSSGAGPAHAWPGSGSSSAARPLWRSCSAVHRCGTWIPAGEVQRHQVDRPLPPGSRLTDGWSARGWRQWYCDSTAVILRRPPARPLRDGPRLSRRLPPARR
jgi:hypothetical protein